MEPHRQPLAGDQAEQGQSVRRAAHVLLHQPHAAGVLDVEPAAVEAHALADDRDARMLGVALFGLDQPRRALARGGGADRGDQRIAFARARRREVTRTLPPKRAGLVAHRLLELGRAEVAGGGVDQVADQRGRLGQADLRSMRAPRR